MRPELSERAEEEVRGLNPGRASIRSKDAVMYPATVKLAGRRCLVVGGGAVALRKTEDLLRCGACLHVIASDWRADFAALDSAYGPGGEGRLQRSTRAYHPSDIEDVFLIVAATDDRPTQLAISHAADERGKLCNVVDVPELCNFYVPATVRRGSLSVSVSTEGKSPLLSLILRNKLEKVLGPQFGPALEKLAEARELVRSRYPIDALQRRDALARLVTPEALDELLEGRLDQLEARWESWKSSLPA